MFTVLGLITGLAGPIAQVAGQIASLEAAKLKAQTDEEHQKIGAALAEAHDRHQALIDQVGARLKAIMQFMLACPTMILLWKLEVYDKALGQWTGGYTDPLGPYLASVIIAVIAFYFGYDIAAKWRK